MLLGAVGVVPTRATQEERPLSNWPNCKYVQMRVNRLNEGYVRFLETAESRSIHARFQIRQQVRDLFNRKRIKQTFRHWGDARLMK